MTVLDPSRLHSTRSSLCAFPVFLFRRVMDGECEPTCLICLIQQGFDGSSSQEHLRCAISFPSFPRVSELSSELPRADRVGLQSSHEPARLLGAAVFLFSRLRHAAKHHLASQSGGRIPYTRCSLAVTFFSCLGNPRNTPELLWRRRQLVCATSRVSAVALASIQGHCEGTLLDMLKRETE